MTIYRPLEALGMVSLLKQLLACMIKTLTDLLQITQITPARSTLLLPVQPTLLPVQPALLPARSALLALPLPILQTRSAPALSVLVLLVFLLFLVSLLEAAGIHIEDVNKFNRQSKYHQHSWH